VKGPQQPQAGLLQPKTGLQMLHASQQTALQACIRVGIAAKSFGGLAAAIRKPANARCRLASGLCRLAKARYRPVLGCSRRKLPR
jgi:hypothetical protein